MDNKNIEYLKKVADFIVEDSNFVVGHTLILKTPFYTFSWEYFLRNQNNPPLIYFVEYIEDMYGVPMKEAKYVWNSYVSKIKEKRYGHNKETISENIDDRHQHIMGNPYDFFGFSNINDNLKQKLITIIEHTVDNIYKTISYEQLEDRDDMYVIKINGFKLVYGMYLENDGSEESFKKFCITYMDYILKEMLSIFSDYIDKNPSLAPAFGLGATVMLCNKMSNIFID